MTLYLFACEPLKNTKVIEGCGRMGNSSVQQGSLSCGASPCKTDLPWIQGFHAASVIDLNGTISSKKSIEQIWRDTQQAQSCSPKMRQGAAQFSPSILAFWKAHFGPFSEACQLWTWISEHYEMVHLHFFFSSCRRWRKKKTNHKTVLACTSLLHIAYYHLLSILNLTVGQHHGHAQYKVYRVILHEYIQYTCLSICMIHHDSACLNEDLLGSH